MECDDSLDALKEALAAKNRECTDLRQQLLQALQAKKDLQTDFNMKHQGLQEECSGLRRQLESVEQGTSRSGMPTTPQNSTAPPSECDEDTEMAGVRWSDQEAAVASNEASDCSSEKGTSPQLEMLRTASMMRRARSTPSFADLESTESSADEMASAISADDKQRFEMDALQRVREAHRRNGDRNLAGFMRDLGFGIEGGWNPTEDEFEKQRKRGLVLCHPDKQQKKPLREQYLSEAVFKELNDWAYKPPLDRPHFGFRGLCPQPSSARGSSPGHQPGTSFHRRSTSGTGYFGYSPGASGYTNGYKTSASTLEIASRIARKSVDVSNRTTSYMSPRNMRGSTGM